MNIDANLLPLLSGYYTAMLISVSIFALTRSSIRHQVWSGQTRPTETGFLQEDVRTTCWKC